MYSLGGCAMDSLLTEGRFATCLALAKDLRVLANQTVVL